jgi:hypothetical protein
MKQMWIWFGVVYGNLNALVMSVVVGAFGVDSEAGRAFCSVFSVDIGTCRVWILVALISFFGTATVLSLRKLMAVRKAEALKDK